MGLFLAFTCSTYKQTGVTTYLCALHMLDSPSSELGLITASTFWFPNMTDNWHNTLTHTHTHTPQSLQSESTIQLPNNVIVKIRQVNQRIRWYKINYATSLLLFQTTLARFAYSPFCITCTYVSTILHKWFCWSASPNKCDKNLI